MKHFSVAVGQADRGQGQSSLGELKIADRRPLRLGAIVYDTCTTPNDHKGLSKGQQPHDPTGPDVIAKTAMAPGWHRRAVAGPSP